MFLSLNEGKNCKMHLEQTKLACQSPTLHGFFLICNIFSVIDQCLFFFTSGICSDILMNMLQD